MGLAYLFKNETLKNFSIYFLTGLTNRLGSAIIFPFTFIFLKPEDYALFALAHSLITLLTILFGAGLKQVLMIEYFKNNDAQNQELINFILNFYFFIIAPIFAIAILFRNTIGDWLVARPEGSGLIVFCAVFSFLSFFNEIYLQLLRLKNLAKNYSKLQIINTFISICASYILVAYFDKKAYGLLYANLFGAIFIFFNGFNFIFPRKVIQNLKFCHKLNYIWQGLSYMPTILCGWIISSSAKFFLSRFSTLDQLGLYSFAESFGYIFYLCILQPLNGSYVQDVLKNFAQNQKFLEIEKTNKKNLARAMAAMFLLVFIGYFCAIKLFYLLLPSSYLNAINYIFILFVGYTFMMGSYFTTILLEFKKKNLFLIFSFAFVAIVNLFLNKILIPQYHAWGACIAGLISYVLYFVITLIFNYLVCRYQIRET